MSSFKFTMLILFGISLVLVSAEKCANDNDCYKEEVEAMVTKLNAGRDELVRKLSGEMMELEKKKSEVAKSATQVEAESRALNEKAKALKERAAKLDQVTREISDKHDKIGQLHATFKSEHAASTSSSDVLSNDEEKLRNNHMFREAKIYQDIFMAFRHGVCKKIGIPGGWNDRSHPESNKWNGQALINLGVQRQNYGNGMTVQVPNGYDLIWLRVTNHVWARFTVTYWDNGRHDLGQFAAGYRNLNEISPDGGTPDAFHKHHMWMSIPVKKSGEHMIRSSQHSNSWISGIAFGKNLWNHASNSAVAYHWAINGGTSLQWHTHNWENDQLACINTGKVNRLVVPVVPNGKDKLFYIVEHDNNWVGTMHTGLKVNGVAIERLRTSYTNPFATHFNSKHFSRYIAAFIPSARIPRDARFINIDIDMNDQDEHIFFREAGTHDFE
jgi:hypothetical protein